VKNFFIAFLCLSIFGCSPGFYIRAAYEESKILLARQNIQKLIKEKNINPELQRKLKLVTDARDFAEKMGLTPKQSFTTYSQVDNDVLVWVVAGCKPTSFELHTWWFPIVGEVPYKGFFSKKAAEKEERRLQTLGFETSIRGSEALSTLGWFNDPVLSTTLKNQDDWIVNTVIHETTHSTVWIPGSVPFNESLASFVGFQAAIEFYTSIADPHWIGIANKRNDMEFEIALVLEDLYSELDELYKSKASEQVKLILRSKIFTKHVNPLHKKYPEMRILKEINNSQLMQLKFYMTKLTSFKKLWIKVDRNWPNFFTEIKKISSLSKDNSKLDPYKHLEQALE